LEERALDLLGREAVHERRVGDRRKLRERVDLAGRDTAVDAEELALRKRRRAREPGRPEKLPLLVRGSRGRRLAGRRKDRASAVIRSVAVRAVEREGRRRSDRDLPPSVRRGVARDPLDADGVSVRETVRD